MGDGTGALPWCRRTLGVRMGLQVGYKVPAHQAHPAELADLAGAAERAGFDAVFVDDQFQPWRQAGHAPSAAPWLGFVGARTSRIRLGTIGYAALLRRHPAVVAQEFATLGCLLPGRVILGLGIGDGSDEVSATGKKWPPVARRLGRLREAAQLIRQLWTGTEVTFAGQFYRTDKARIHDVPSHSVPLWVWAGSDGEARIAAEVADGVVGTSGTGVEFQRDVVLPAVSSAAPGFARALEIRLSYEPRPKQALRSARLWAPATLDVHSDEAPGLFEPNGHHQPTDLFARRWIVASTPDQVHADLEPYLQLGFDRLVFTSPGNNQKKFLRRLATEIIPALRTRTS